MSQWKTVIGLEVHAQLSTKSKIFATSSTQPGNPPNTQTDPVTLGLPGVLPVLNKKVVDLAIKLGLATNCQIREQSIFARKHYFYPDLPKGYQISQYDKPICERGWIEITTKKGNKKIRLRRIHLEEDAGKNSHLSDEPYSVVDLNRAGVPLVEIVSEPEIHSAREASAYMKKLRQIVRYLDICDGNMEAGNLRCDANISVRRLPTDPLGTKVEIKNLNSFRHVEKAIEFEIDRQISHLEQGGTIVQETRLWDETRGISQTMRIKESTEDYRYLTEPDLLPLMISRGWIEKIKENFPELPTEAEHRFRENYGLDSHMSALLTEEKATRDYVDESIAIHDNPLGIANWISTELFAYLNKEGLEIADSPVTPKHLAELVKLIDEKIISGKIAKTIFEQMFKTKEPPQSIVEKKGLVQISDEVEIEKFVRSTLEQNPSQVEEFKNGKQKIFGFFVGQIMKASKGKVNPEKANEILKRLLNES